MPSSRTIAAANNASPLASQSTVRPEASVRVRTLPNRRMSGTNCNEATNYHRSSTDRLWALVAGMRAKDPIRNESNQFAMILFDDSFRFRFPTCPFAPSSGSSVCPGCGCVETQWHT